MKAFLTKFILMTFIQQTVKCLIKYLCHASTWLDCANLLHGQNNLAKNKYTCFHTAAFQLKCHYGLFCFNGFILMDTTGSYNIFTWRVHIIFLPDEPITAKQAVVS